jgi:hypothetical protein
MSETLLERVEKPEFLAQTAPLTTMQLKAVKASTTNPLRLIERQKQKQAELDFCRLS